MASAKVLSPTPSDGDRTGQAYRLNRAAGYAIGSMVVAYSAACVMTWTGGLGGMYMLLGTALAGLLCVGLGVGLQLRLIRVGTAISVLTAVNIIYLCSKLMYLTLLAPADLFYTLSSEYLWAACTPVLAFTMPVSRFILRFLWVQPVICTLALLGYPAIHHPGNPHVVYSLVQLVLINWTVLVAVREFGGTLGQLRRARKDNMALARLAYHDELTGLPNRLGLERRLQEVLDSARQAGHGVAVIFLDLDGFKPINDTLGHQLGDELLQKFARRIGRVTQSWGEGARFAGDEFVVMAPIYKPEQLESDGRAFQASLSHSILVQGERVELTVSAGMSVFPRDGQTVHELLRRADIAMLSAKKSGKNSIHFYGTHLHAESEYRQLLSRDLVGVTTRQELHLVYQPIYDVRSGEVHSCEALLRWEHPTLGNISPSTFIPLAESNGSILPIGLWVIRQALHAAAELRASGVEQVRIAVNASPIQLMQPDFASMVRAELSDAGVDGNVLELEITEGLALSDREAVVALLGELRAMNIMLSLDDFGEGFASLSHVRDLPVQHIKLDRSFLAGISGRQSEAARYSRALIISILQLAEALQLKVVAEGVETPEQCALLRELGCQYAQGYLYSCPLGLKALLAFLQERRPPLPSLDITEALPLGDIA